MGAVPAHELLRSVESRNSCRGGSGVWGFAIIHRHTKTMIVAICMRNIRFSVEEMVGLEAVQSWESIISPGDVRAGAESAQDQQGSSLADELGLRAIC